MKRRQDRNEGEGRKRKKAEKEENREARGERMTEDR